LPFSSIGVCSHQLPFPNIGVCSVLVTGNTTIELARKTDAAAIARLIVTAHGTGLASERLKSANLMVSELVTNACRHGSGRISLTVNSNADGVQAEVHDEGVESRIAISDPRPERGGWGLYFVDRLADAWGVGADEARVWFRVAA
jgi:anti-sigma regulatory factor (Ser/Thr protein kinase)